MMITDEQCEEFRRLPVNFNDMLRATYEAGYMARIVDEKEFNVIDEVENSELSDKGDL